MKHRDYILPEHILTMEQFRKECSRYGSPDPDDKEIKAMRKRKYEVIIGQFNQIVSKQTEFTPNDERPSQVRY